MSRSPALILTRALRVLREGKDNKCVSNCQSWSSSSWWATSALRFRAVESDMHWPQKHALWPSHRDAEETPGEIFSAKYNFTVCSRSIFEESCLSYNLFKRQWQVLKDPGEKAMECIIGAWSDHDIAWISEPLQYLRVGALTKSSLDMSETYGGGSRR